MSVHHLPSPMSKIGTLSVDLIIIDNRGGVANGMLGPFGQLIVDPADRAAMDPNLTPDEILARWAALDYINGTSPEVLHNIVNEGIERAKSLLDHLKRSPAS